jgi:hypothetical protein
LADPVWACTASIRPGHWRWLARPRAPGTGTAGLSVPRGYCRPRSGGRGRRSRDAGRRRPPAARLTEMDSPRLRRGAVTVAALGQEPWPQPFARTRTSSCGRVARDFAEPRGALPACGARRSGRPAAGDCPPSRATKWFTYADPELPGWLNGAMLVDPSRRG